MKAAPAWATDGPNITHACPSCGRLNRVPPEHLADLGRCGACRTELLPLDRPLAAGPPLFDAIVRGARVPVLVDFWAGWCEPCRIASPEVAKAAAHLAGRAVVLKVDTEAAPELAARYGVRSIPNFLVTRDGAPVFQQAGLVDHRTLERWVS